MNGIRSITTPALAARVRRRLARERQLLRRCWPWDARHAERGDYFVLAAHTHDVLARHVNVVVEDDGQPYTDGTVPAAWMGKRMEGQR
jgi:hypothetical protein